MTMVLTLRQGTTAEHAAFTGAEGELSYDTEKKTVLVHDGSTVGGIPLAKKSEVDVKADDANVVKVVSQTLTDTQADQVCENLKINQAIRELIQEYGGTVPTDSGTQSVQSAQSADDPFAELS